MDRTAVGQSGVEYRLHLDKPLGSPGGFGSVFEASGEGQEFAAKLIRLDQPVPDSLLEREIEIAERVAGIQSDRLICAIDFARTAEEIVLVMPRADGSLADELESGVHTEAEAASTIREIALGLQDLHAGGLLHRDLKPANVLRLGGRLCLADFGISRDLKKATGTATFLGAGTPEYMAPEQWTAGAQTTSIDLYALGCIAHELATGSPPFVGSPERLRELHLTQAPDPLDDVLANARFRGIVRRMLNKEAGGRPQDARAVAERLADLTFGPPSLEGRLGSIAEKHAEEREEESIRLARARSRADRLRILTARAGADLLDILQDAHEILRGALGDVSFSANFLRLSTDDGSLEFQQDLSPMGDEGESNFVAMAVAITGSNRRLRESRVFANAAYMPAGDRMSWSLLTFNRNAITDPGTYRLGPGDAHHGLELADFRAEHAAGRLPRLIGMHVYSVHTAHLDGAAVAELFATMLEASPE